jgi:hypothetical protein
MQKIGPGLMGFVLLCKDICIVWVPVLGCVLAPIGFFVAFLAALVLWILALIPHGTISFQCQDCKEWFPVKKSELPS